MFKTLTMIVLIAAACGLPRVVFGQHVHKCVSGAHVSYQSEPCKDPRQMAGRWDATPETQQDALGPPGPSRRSPPAAGRRPPASRAGSTRSLTAQRTARSTTPAPARGTQACRAARAHRDATERNLGLKRDYRTLQVLGRLVQEACR